MKEKRNGDFIIKKSEVKYKNPWIEVVEDQVIRPNGDDGIFGVVKMVGGVSVLALDDEGYVYLTDEFHYAIGKNDIETISGGADKGEDRLVTAKRELKEESGIEAEEWIDLGTVHPFTTVVGSMQKIFLARKLKFRKDQQEDTEDIKLVKVKFEEAVRMVMDSEITHGPSCFLILKADKYLRENK
ncbi:MAG: NUDIX hydrolase [Candidatus Moranbacteria bacterium]|nr:NUDIX hydrolase [Candidatus Moranbacteria bacterium]